MYATQMKVKGSVINQIIDIDEQYLDQDAQVIVLFNNSNYDDENLELTPGELAAYNLARQEQRNGNTYSLKDLEQLVGTNE